jgi:hypothetical protein
MTKIEQLQRDRKIFRELRPKMSQLEKLWLLDCQGNYTIYVRRLHHLAKEYGIKIEEK